MFKEHGSFEIKLLGNVLILNIHGAWNIETSLKYRDAINACIKPIVGQKWAVLTQMTDWELCTPDSEAVLADLIVDAISKGLVREAVVNNKGAIKLELFEKYKKLENYNDPETGFKRYIYDEQADALNWLSQEGFPVTL